MSHLRSQFDVQEAKRYGSVQPCVLLPSHLLQHHLNADRLWLVAAEAY